MWTTVTEEGRTGPLLSQREWRVHGFDTHTYTVPPPRHLSSRYTKAGRAPVFPVTWLFRRSFGHIDAFSRPQPC